MKKPENKVSDLFPKPIEIDMLAGKKAIIPPITVETLCMIDENHGGLQSFMTDCLKNPLANIPKISQVIFETIANKEDFADVRDFRKHFDLGAVMKLVEGFTALFNSSMPEVKAVVGDASKAKKFPGQS